MAYKFTKLLFRPHAPLNTHAKRKMSRETDSGEDFLYGSALDPEAEAFLSEQNLRLSLNGVDLDGKLTYFVRTIASELAKEVSEELTLEEAQTFINNFDSTPLYIPPPETSGSHAEVKFDLARLNFA